MTQFELLEHLSSDAFELFGRRESVDGFLADSRLDLLFDARHADHEKFVEVGAEDRDELGAFEQWMLVGPDRLVEHAAVEDEPAQLTVDVE